MRFVEGEWESGKVYDKEEITTLSILLSIAMLNKLQ
jgi:hypothetical protein